MASTNKAANVQGSLPDTLSALRQLAFFAESVWHLQGNGEARKYAEMARAVIAREEAKEKK